MFLHRLYIYIYIYIYIYTYIYISQEKRPTIVGSIATENNICHYIKSNNTADFSNYTARISADKLINVVGQFITHLNTKTHLPLYKTYLCRYGFCNATAPYSPSHHSPFSLSLRAICHAKRLNNAFNNKMGTHDSKMHTSLNVNVKNCC